MTCLMTFKSKYNFSNQWYNDIVKLIVDLIPVKHNMSKDLYQSKKKKIAYCFGMSTRTNNFVTYLSRQG
jgi:hypothetical protein